MSVISQARFAEIKFNLLRAIEIFADMNHLDMDVTAPTSSNNSFKEYEVATRLNEFLGSLIEEGFFEDCDLRDEASDDQSDSIRSYEDETLSFPGSEGFEYDGRSDGPSSRESFTGRFKRYIRRILPGGRRDARQEEEVDYEDEEADETEEPEEAESSVDQQSLPERSAGSNRYRSRSRGRSGSASGSRASNRSDQVAERSRSHSRSRSMSHSRERSGSEPYDPNVVYAHRHRHKHRHPGPHHHHSHGPNHHHSYHSHDGEDSDEAQTQESDGGLSANFRASSEDELSSTALSRSRSASRSSGRRGSGRRGSSRGSRPRSGSRR